MRQRFQGKNGEQTFTVSIWGDITFHVIVAATSDKLQTWISEHSSFPFVSLRVNYFIIISNPQINKSLKLTNTFFYIPKLLIYCP